MVMIYDLSNLIIQQKKANRQPAWVASRAKNTALSEGLRLIPAFSR
jgi:hypothetical protein